MARRYLPKLTLEQFRKKFCSVRGLTERPSHSENLGEVNGEIVWRTANGIHAAYCIKGRKKGDGWILNPKRGFHQVCGIGHQEREDLRIAKAMEKASNDLVDYKKWITDKPGSMGYVAKRYWTKNGELLLFYAKEFIGRRPDWTGCSAKTVYLKYELKENEDVTRYLIMVDYLNDHGFSVTNAIQGTIKREAEVIGQETIQGWRGPHTVNIRRKYDAVTIKLIIQG